MAQIVTMNFNPAFSNVTGLTNTTFDQNDYVEDRMATEAQIAQAVQAVIDLETRKDYYCREIVVWKSFVRVVEQGTGIVVSGWLDNIAVGSARRGAPFTVEFALPYDADKYLDNTGHPNGSSKNFSIRVNKPGSAKNLEDNFFANEIGKAVETTSSSIAFWAPASSWCGGTSNSSQLLMTATNSATTNSLPTFSTVSGVENLYYIFKDATTNKLKIDVRRRDQYADAEYLALFFTQFVQRQ